MKVTVKLFALFLRYKPVNSTKGIFELEIKPGCMVADLVEQIGIPRDAERTVLINGRYCPSPDLPIQSGDVVSIFPPMAGG